MLYRSPHRNCVYYLIWCGMELIKPLDTQYPCTSLVRNVCIISGEPFYPCACKLFFQYPELICVASPVFRSWIYLWWVSRRARQYSNTRSGGRQWNLVQVLCRKTTETYSSLSHLQPMCCWVWSPLPRKINYCCRIPRVWYEGLEGRATTNPNVQSRS